MSRSRSRSKPKPPALAAPRAPKAPTAPSVPSALLAAALEQRSRAFLRRLLGLGTRRSPEAVHDLRVAARRLMAVIDLIGGALDDRELGRLRRRLKRLLKDFNIFRDLEIQRGAMGGLAARFAVLRPLARALRSRERTLLPRAVRRAARFDRAALEQTVAGAIASLSAMARWPNGEAALLENARAAHAASYAALLRMRTLVNKNRPRSLHRLRITLKKNRYAAEILLPYLTGLRPRHLKSMNALQTAFGAVQDQVVVMRCVRQYMRTGDPGGAMLPVLEVLNSGRTGLIDRALSAVPAIDEFWGSPPFR